MTLINSAKHLPHNSGQHETLVEIIELIRHEHFKGLKMNYI